MQNLAKRIVHRSDEATLNVVPSLVSLAKSTRQIMGLKLASTGVLVGQDNLLDALSLDEAVEVSVIAHRLNVRPSTTSKMLDHLVAKGLALREPGEDDRRKTYVRLTPAGVTAQQQVQRVWAQLNDELTKALDEAGAEEQTYADLRCLDEALVARLSRLR